MTATLSTTPSLLLQLDSKMAYLADEKDEERRRSGQSNASVHSRQKKVVDSCSNIFKNLFDAKAFFK